VENFEGLKACSSRSSSSNSSGSSSNDSTTITTKALGSKPCMLFVGPDWENNENLKKTRNLLTGISSSSS
jgi:hypothetical protein